MKPKVYVDGHVGTTGLRIRDWLAQRDDLDVLTLPESARRDAAARREAVRSAEVAVLCLPDDAAREAVQWVHDCPTRVIDASTAHRVADGWVYGLPELTGGQRAAIRGAKYVANPGCYASAVILLIRPLIDAGLLAPEAALSIHALSGYSGGGKQLIERWEDHAGGLLDLPYEAPYALGRVHKHIPEMMRYARLRTEPQFVPAVGPFRCGMRVEVALHATLLGRGTTGEAVHGVLTERYRDEPFVRVQPALTESAVEERSLDPLACNDTNRIELSVAPHPSGHVLLVAVLDNLGKGAAGVAIQSLNLLLGLDETRGLPR
jgi:N-acetyl-gamma-glutamyl-phosphate reductase